MLASMEPIETLTGAELAAHLPPNAAKDLLEWSLALNSASYLQQVVSQEISVEETLAPNPKIRVTDDQPYNEYFLLRQSGLFNQRR